MRAIFLMAGLALAALAGPAGAAAEPARLGVDDFRSGCADGEIAPRLKNAYCTVLSGAGLDPTASFDIDGLFQECADQTEPYLTWEVQSAWCVVLAAVAEDDVLRADAFYWSAYALDELGRYDEAIADLDRAIELSPDFYNALLNRGLARRKNGQLEAAIADYGRAIEIDPDRETAYNNRGSVYLRLERYDLAIEDFRASLEREPGNLRTRYNFGLALEYAGYPEAALAIFDTVLASGDEAGRFVDLAQLQFQRAQAFIDLGDAVGAVAAFEGLLRHEPDDTDAHSALAQLRAFGPPAVRDLDKALYHARENLRLDPGDGIGVYTLARIQAEKGDLAEAVATHRRIIDNHWIYRGVYIDALKSQGYLDESAPSDRWSDAAQAALVACVRDNCETFE